MATNVGHNGDMLESKYGCFHALGPNRNKLYLTEQRYKFCSFLHLVFDHHLHHLTQTQMLSEGWRDRAIEMVKASSNVLEAIWAQPAASLFGSESLVTTMHINSVKFFGAQAGLWTSPS